MVYDWLADVITAKNKSCEKIDFIDTPIDGICFQSIYQNDIVDLSTTKKIVTYYATILTIVCLYLYVRGRL